MKTRSLGNTGYKVSEIGFGAWVSAARCGAVWTTVKVIRRCAKRWSRASPSSIPRWRMARHSERVIGKS